MTLLGDGCVIAVRRREHAPLTALRRPLEADRDRLTRGPKRLVGAKEVHHASREAVDLPNHRVSAATKRCP